MTRSCVGLSQIAQAATYKMCGSVSLFLISDCYAALSTAAHTRLPHSETSSCVVIRKRTVSRLQLHCIGSLSNTMGQSQVVVMADGAMLLGLLQHMMIGFVLSMF